MGLHEVIQQLCRHADIGSIRMGAPCQIYNLKIKEREEQAIEVTRSGKHSPNKGPHGPISVLQLRDNCHRRATRTWFVVFARFLSGPGIEPGFGDYPCSCSHRSSGNDPGHKTTQRETFAAERLS